ncbi:MAG: sugar transferase [Anaerolineales bacterium]|nr:sugar transferase [Anaerolineales bacterium]
MFKRLFDVVFAVLGLVVLSPALLLISLIIKLSSSGPVFYRATRVGRYGKEFRLLKFRSMVVNADQMGPAVTGANDPRVTPIGRLLRKTKLDELPQLINVLVGDMSFVGPRPEALKYVKHYTDEQREVLSVRPGITSAASIVYRHEEALLVGEDTEAMYVQTIMPAKLAIDLNYVQSGPSVVSDMVLILKTFRALFKKS